MKLSTMLDYATNPIEAVEEASQLEAAGVDMAWVAELYGFDAVSILGYLAARTDRMELGSGILPVYGRSPALIAATAAGLDAVSGGRFVLGLGASGPQVVEGWHGISYDRPLQRTREVIDICRIVWRREQLTYNGIYNLPLPEDQGMGLGKSLKLINHPVRDRIPIYIASLGPKNVAMTAELADGWLPTFFHPDKAGDVWGQDLAVGKARRDPSLPALEIVAGGTLAITNDRAEATRIRNFAREMTALYVGGMGSRTKNFYNELFCRYGYESQAALIQDLYLKGRTGEAAAAVPEDFLRDTALVGDAGFVKDRIRAFRAAGVTRLNIKPVGDDRIALIERVRRWIDE